jgi:hypothetical protein
VAELFLLELEGAELLVDDLPYDLVGRHGCGLSTGGGLWSSILAGRMRMRRKAAELQA